MARGIGGELGLAHPRQPLAQRRLGASHALLALDRRIAARQHDLGLVIERAQQLALPAVPDARPHGLDVADGQDEQQLQAFERLHDARERLDRARIGQIAALRDRRHIEMMLDQPGDGLGLRRGESETRAQAARDAGAGERMILLTPLGDVMEKQRHIQDAPRAQGRHQLVGEGMLVLDAARVDFSERADGADEMLVDGVVMIHVELHHRDDAAEIGNEPAENAGLVHAPEHRFRAAPRGEDFEKQPVGLAIGAQGAIDAPERPGHGADRVRMDREVVLVRQLKQADQVDGIALERLRVRDADAVVVDDEIGIVDARRAAAETPHQPVQHGPRLVMPRLERSADDGGEIADVLGDEKIALHEALDRGQAAMIGIADLRRDQPLHVERQALLGAARGEMHVAANAP